MRHYGKTSLSNIIQNLPGDCQNKVEAIKANGWKCAFYLSVFEGKMQYGMVADNGEEQTIVCSTEIEAIIDTLVTKTRCNVT